MCMPQSTPSGSRGSADSAGGRSPRGAYGKAGNGNGGNGNWKWKLETETGNVRAHYDIDLAGGPLSKERLCLSTVERSSYIASYPGFTHSLVPKKQQE